MKNIARSSVLTLIVIVSLLLSSCGPTDTSGPAATATTPAGSEAATPAATTGAAGDAATPTSATGGDAKPTTPAGGDTATEEGGMPGVLRMNAGSEPDTIDPQKMSFLGEIGVAQLVFEGLMELNDKLEPVPAAAEKMDVSDDGLKYTLTLRDGLQYSDGEPITAKNFEYSWRRLFDPNVPGRSYASVAYDIKGAAELSDVETPVDEAKLKELQDNLGVKALDDKTIEFTLNQKAAYFPYILTLWTGFPSRQDLVEEGGEEWTTDSTGKYYVGNGPFVMKENTEQGMKLVANPNFRKGKPKTNELRFAYINDSAVSFQSYKKGELDVVGVAPEDYSAVQADPKLKSQFAQYPGSCSFYIGFNTKKPPFDNMKVRQAFAQALDRDDYVNNVQKGLGQKAQSFIPPGRPGHAPDIKLWDFNAEAAKKALADAGFPDAAGLPEIKLTYSSSPRNKTRMEWIQNQIKNNLGVDMALDPIEPKAYTALVKEPETTPQVFFLAWCQDYPDPQNWLTLVFHSSSTVTKVGWKNDEFDRLTRQADQESDQKKRIDLYRQAQEILVQEAAIVNIYWEVNTILVKPYVKGMKEKVNPQDTLVPGFFNILNIEVSP